MAPPHPRPPPYLAAVSTAGSAAICHASSTLSLLPTRDPLRCEHTALREVKKNRPALPSLPFHKLSVHTRFHITTDVRSLSPEAQRQSHRSSQAGSPRSQALSPLPGPLAQHRLRLWERRPPRRERADLCWRKHLCSEGEGEPFPTISCSVRGPGAGVAARGLFFEAEPHIMRLLTGALRHRAKTQDGYLSINLTLHPPAFYLLT